MRILYVTTTFPVYSETFLQREVHALRELGVELTILSQHRGEPEFDEFEIDCFSKWELPGGQIRFCFRWPCCHNLYRTI